jgi:hypothetical protein
MREATQTAHPADRRRRTPGDAPLRDDVRQSAAEVVEVHATRQRVHVR